MEAKVQIITPELAKKYLERNYNNYRRASSSTVTAYAEDMQNGSWELNGESIKFSENGSLIDGQHRLMAVVKAGVGVPMLVVTGVKDGTTLCDVGKGRTLSQIAVSNKLPFSSSNASVLGAVSLLYSLAGNTVVPKNLVLEQVKANTDLWGESYRVTTVGSSSKRIAKKSTIILAAYVLLRKGVSARDLETFFHVVNSGFPVSGLECSPAIVLRNYLLSSKYAADVRGRDNRLLAFSTTLSAFKDFSEGKVRKHPYRMDVSHLSELRNLRKDVFGE